jgi:hypothetical protein
MTYSGKKNKKLNVFQKWTAGAVNLDWLLGTVREFNLFSCSVFSHLTPMRKSVKSHGHTQFGKT